MERMEKAIEVERPLSTVYNQWTQFEEFPRFMKGVKKVTQLDDQRLHWKAEIGGKDKEWNARITDQVPDQLIAWQSEGAEYTSGPIQQMPQNFSDSNKARVVKFAPAGPNRTRITLEVIYDPEGFVEKTGDA